MGARQTTDVTADGGHGAPAPRTARDAVRQTATRHGSEDPDSEWTRRKRALDKRARTEHEPLSKEELYFGLTKELLPGESFERVRGLTAAAEQRRTDRYLDRPTPRGPHL